MPLTTREAFRDSLGRYASHANHPVTLISPHRFFRTANGAILPFKKTLGCVALTCDPLLCQDQPEEDALGDTLAEFDAAFAANAAVFAGVSEAVARELARLGFAVLKMGEEPWVDLDAWEPKGNRGKGIRAARNQALRAGCVAEIWSEERFRSERQFVEEVFREWRGLTFISLEGGIMGTAPFADIPGRRFYVAILKGRLEAVLVATPVRPGYSYYLEDLVYRRQAPRGVQELLTLTALEALHKEGAKRVSLGLVLLRRMERASVSTYSPRSIPARLLRKGIALAYNAEGQDLFRKRFPVAAWEAAYLAFRAPRRLLGGVLPLGPAAVLAWSLIAMMMDLEPTIYLPW